MISRYVGLSHVACENTKEEQMKNARFKFVLLIVWVLATLHCPRTANAQVVIYNTIRAVSGDGATGFDIWSAPGAPPAVYAYLAASFVPTGSYTLTRLDVLATYFVYDTPFGRAGTNSGAVVQLLSDAVGQPGSVLESWTIPPPLPLFDYKSPQLLTPTSPIQLASGTRYWVVMSVLPNSSGNPEVSWMITAPNPGTTLASDDGTTWPFSLGGVPAFDVWGLPTGATRFLYQHRGVRQTIRLKVTAVAGPTTVPPATPVEASLGFLDANGSAIGPSRLVRLSPGQTEFLDLGETVPVGAEVLPVVSTVPGAASFNGPIAASVEIFDDALSIGNVFQAGTVSLPSVPVFDPQGVAGGQTIRLTAFALPPDPCVATLGFQDVNGSPVGPVLPVNLSPGHAASLDLRAEALSLRLGQRAEIRPVVTITSGISAAGSNVQLSACPASVEVFDNLTGRTSTYQAPQSQLFPAVQ